MVELLFNLVFIGAGMLADIKLYNTTVTELPQQIGQVVPVMFREEGYNMLTIGTPPSEDGKCKYTGFAVAIDRTWDEIHGSGNSMTVLPAEPGKLMGYAIVINKKTCPGQAPESMFRVATRDERSKLFNRYEMQKGYPILSLNYSSLQEDARPKWTEQVMTVLENTAATNPEVKAFMDDIQQAAAKAAPQKAVQEEPKAIDVD